MPPKPRNSVPPPPSQQRPLSVLRVLRDDVDHAVDRVGAPQRGAWPADDFDPIDVLQERILDVPKHPGEQRRIDRPPVYQHQQFVGESRC